MIRNYYKFHGMIGVIFIGITLFIAAMNVSECMEGYYWVLYNRVYFASMYLPLFLCGLLPVFSDIFLEEAMVRYKNRQEIYEKLSMCLFSYSVFYSCLFCIVNLFMMNLWHMKMEISAAAFLFLAFFCQCTGWFLICSVYSCIYFIIKHAAGTWGIVLICFLAMTSLAEEFGTNMILSVWSPYHFMYQFILEKQLIWLLAKFFGEIGCAVIFLGIGFWVFRLRDITGDKRGE